jgi:hypothetical protein
MLDGHLPVERLNLFAVSTIAVILAKVEDRGSEGTVMAPFRKCLESTQNPKMMTKPTIKIILGLLTTYLAE